MCKVKLSSGADSCVVVQPEQQILEQLENSLVVEKSMRVAVWPFYCKYLYECN